MLRDETDDWHLAKQIAAGILIAAAVLGAVYYSIQVEKVRRVNAAFAELAETFQAIEAEQRAEQVAARKARESKARANFRGRMSLRPHDDTPLPVADA